MDWEQEQFARWLRMQRRVEHPMSQEQLAELIGVTQSKVSRWEKGKPSDPPELIVCSNLVDVFGGDLIDLAIMCGRWDADVERKILAEFEKGRARLLAGIAA